ncbi:MAG: serine hydrolase domain-containing protein [Dysgonomonas sp.]
MKIRRFLLLLLLFSPIVSNAQIFDIRKEIDPITKSESNKPFNGAILIAENDSILYREKFGFSDLKAKDSLTWKNTFIIGSISKQITAVLVLEEVEKGNIKLEDPISTYLPDLPQKWKDTVTVHQLLTHTHGIVSVDEHLKFIPGDNFSYSQIGYQLLANILEKINDDSFANISSQLFKKCRMENTFHPLLYKNSHLAKCYSEDETGNIEEQFPDSVFVPAGGFISTADDLLLWNENLFQKDLLRKETLDIMTSTYKGAIRNHPLFGLTLYGYGITVDNKSGLLQLGQTGYLPYFASMNYYFPEFKTSVIVLENISYGNNLSDIFLHHTQILDIVRIYLKKKKHSNE